MVQCLSIESSSATSSIPVSPAAINNHARPPLSQGNSREGTPSPARSTQRSPNINLGSEYTLNVHTNSYNEMWSKIHVPNNSNHYSYDQDQVQVRIDHRNGDEGPHQLHLSQVLQPNREIVEEALQHAKPNTITRLVSAYFDHSENTTNLCLLLRQCIYRTRALYAPLLELLEIVPLDDDHYFTQSHCDRAFEVFLHFDSADNPFPCPDSHNFQEMRRSFSQLKQQLDNNIRKSHSRVRLFRRATTGSALCVIGTAVAVTIAAAVVATHALIAIVAVPFCPAYFPRDLTKKERARVAQLDAAARGTFVLSENLNTTDRLVARLYTAIEGDKQLVKMALERSNDKYCIHEVLKQLRTDQQKFTSLLERLEEHVCLGFTIVNRARSSLLDEIRTTNS